MNRIAVACIALLGGCAWSNSLYQARLLSKDAVRAEREMRPFEARSIWIQVVDRADSAYARSPRGKRGAEALWLAGHASFRTDDCAHAMPALEAAWFAQASAPWREQLLLELGQCEEASGAPAAASIYGMLTTPATDPAIRRQARIRQGHVLVLQSQWNDGLAALQGEDTLPARLDRAMALANLGQTDRALSDLAPLLAAGDTTVKWSGFVEALAHHGSAATDTLLARLLAFPNVREDQRAAWLFAGARGALSFDPPASDRRLQQLATRPAGRWVGEGQLLQLELRVTRASAPEQVRVVLDSLRRAGDLPEVPAAAHFADVQREAEGVLTRNDSTRPGLPGGDLVMFALAEFARDTLGAPRLGAWFFGRLEHDWSASPYVPKALLARIGLEPDSAAALLARARAHRANPYVTAADGDVAGQVRMSRLEDSLGKFVAAFWAKSPLLPRVIQDRE